ncbi:MAG: hypothetical protein AAF437_09145 [Pseudomonadota bacterium]
MTVSPVIRTLVLVIAAIAYLANGAQAHMKIAPGETLEMMLCSSGETRTVSLNLPGAPAEETTETCCGDCTSMSGLSLAAPSASLVAMSHPVLHHSDLPDPVSPRSPLWPGAPPQGPPFVHKV